MSSTVAGLLHSVGLEPEGCVRWGEPVAESRPGVYLASLSRSPYSSRETLGTPPLSESRIHALIAACPEVTLDGRVKPSSADLAERIGRYWLSDEAVLYIGLASRPLRTRVREYYNTPLGASKPHKGGWWLKVLSVLEACYVHVAATADFKNAEEQMLRAFAAGVSDLSQATLPSGEPVMPFANLRDGDWRRREHGIRRATAAGTRTSRRAGTGPSRRAPTAAHVPARAVAAVDVRGSNRSQRVTAKDIAAGRCAFPVSPRRCFPKPAKTSLSSCAGARFSVAGIRAAGRPSALG